MAQAPAGREASTGHGVRRYERHRPEQTLLYRLVEQYYPVLADTMAAQGKPLSAYVEREFEDYLKCGRLEHVGANSEVGRIRIQERGRGGQGTCVFQLAIDIDRKVRGSLDRRHVEPNAHHGCGGAEDCVRRRPAAVSVVATQAKPKPIVGLLEETPAVAVNPTSGHFVHDGHITLRGSDVHAGRMGERVEAHPGIHAEITCGDL